MAENVRNVLFFSQKPHDFYVYFAFIFCLDFPKPLKVVEIMGSFERKRRGEDGENVRG